MIDLSTILQAIQRFRPEMLQGILGGGGANMQSMNGGGFRAEPFAPEPAPPWMGMPIDPMPMPPKGGGMQPFEPFPMPMARGGGIPNQIVPDVPGAGSGGRSAGMGSFGRERIDLPRQAMPDRFRGATGMGMGEAGGNQIATRPAPGGRRMGGTVVRPSPAGGRGNAVDPRKRAPRKPKYGGAASRGY